MVTMFVQIKKTDTHVAGIPTTLRAVSKLWTMKYEKIC